MEFSFEYVDPDDTGDTLQTFIEFANELWDAEIAPIPHHLFWVSWVQKVLDESVNMAAFCERIDSPVSGKPVALSVRVMFENQRGNGLVFINNVGRLVVGDHLNATISHAHNDSAGLLVDTGFAIVKALIGALATPQAIRRTEGEPAKLNKHRAKKGKPKIQKLVVIDVRASRMVSSTSSQDGSRSVRPHWRRGHLRRLANGRIIPVAPCCVNMEDGISIKPEYLVRV